MPRHTLSDVPAWAQDGFQFVFELFFDEDTFSADLEEFKQDPENSFLGNATVSVLRKAMLGDEFRVVMELESMAITEVSQALGKRVVDEGHDSHGDLVCKVWADTFEEAEALWTQGFMRWIPYGELHETPYMSVRGIMLFVGDEFRFVTDDDAGFFKSPPIEGFFEHAVLPTIRGPRFRTMLQILRKINEDNRFPWLTEEILVREHQGER